ncbi:MAG: hypothetical protein NT074_01680 [Methanomicrobiales archaeon]|jgi:hypothetical protein|nr:hypothetical protein [Methanomicrobiales archaeon]
MIKCTADDLFQVKTFSGLIPGSLRIIKRMEGTATVARILFAVAKGNGHPMGPFMGDVHPCYLAFLPSSHTT